MCFCCCCFSAFFVVVVFCFCFCCWYFLLVLLLFWVLVVLHVLLCFALLCFVCVVVVDLSNVGPIRKGNTWSTDRLPERNVLRPPGYRQPSLSLFCYGALCVPCLCCQPTCRQGTGIRTLLSNTGHGLRFFTCTTISVRP